MIKSKPMIALEFVRELYSNPNLGPLLRRIDNGFEDLKKYREVLQFVPHEFKVGLSDDFDGDFGNCLEE